MVCCLGRFLSWCGFLHLFLLAQGFQNIRNTYLQQIVTPVFQEDDLWLQRKPLHSVYRVWDTKVRSKSFEAVLPTWYLSVCLRNGHLNTSSCPQLYCLWNHWLRWLTFPNTCQNKHIMVNSSWCLLVPGAHQHFQNVHLYFLLPQLCEERVLLLSPSHRGWRGSTVALNDLPKFSELSGRAGCEPRPADSRVRVFHPYTIVPLFYNFHNMRSWPVCC